MEMSEYQYLEHKTHFSSNAIHLIGIAGTFKDYCAVEFRLTNAGHHINQLLVLRVFEYS